MSLQVLKKGEIYKAVSLWQPHASLMSTGAKKIETRSWKTDYRGWMIIHAAKRRVKVDLFYYLSLWSIQGGLAPLKGKPLDLSFKSWPGVEIDDLPFGMALAVGRLRDCRSTDDLLLREFKYERPFGDYSPGRWAWMFSDLKRFEKPLPVRGWPGIFDITIPYEVKLEEVME